VKGPVTDQCVDACVTWGDQTVWTTDHRWNIQTASHLCAGACEPDHTTQHNDNTSLTTNTSIMLLLAVLVSSISNQGTAPMGEYQFHGERRSHSARLRLLDFRRFSIFSWNNYNHSATARAEISLLYWCQIPYSVKGINTIYTACLNHEQCITA